MTVDKDTFVGKELDVISQAMQEDDSFAHSWHCNVAMAFYDAFPENHPYPHEWKHEVANEGAARFMKRAFGVVTSNDMLDDSDLGDAQDISED